jgi:putative intracellular protease/amidase
MVAHSLKISNRKETDYEAVFYLGGHGPLWGLAKDKDSIQLIETFYNHQKLFFCMPCACSLGQCKSNKWRTISKRKAHEGLFKY